MSRGSAHEAGRGLSRRSFIRVSGIALGGLASGLACGAPEVSDEEEAALAERTAAQLANSGRGPLGRLRFRGYRGLAELPWFELDAQRRLRLVDESVPRGIDVHTHLGMAYLFAPQPDLHRRTERVLYHLDCDAGEGCELDLDVYMNLNFSESELSALRCDAVRQLTFGSPRSATHTLPNLADELDRMRFDRAAILPIATPLPRGDNTRSWLAAIDASPYRERFVKGGSVHPADADAPLQLDALVRAGVRILKLHPEAQRFSPDDPRAMRVYEACDRLRLPVIFHVGRSGIEPEAVRPFALPRHLDALVTTFPDLPVVFGHGGARDLPDALRVARERPSVSFGIASLGASAIREVIDAVGPERVVFGSDWPFYPVAAALAKLLVATEGRLEERGPILRDNLSRLFAS